jgi:hypothetical protein
VRLRSAENSGVGCSVTPQHADAWHAREGTLLEDLAKNAWPLVERLQHEFAEMPGLSLTTAQRGPRPPYHHGSRGQRGTRRASAYGQNL